MFGDDSLRLALTVSSPAGPTGPVDVRVAVSSEEPGLVLALEQLAPSLVVVRPESAPAAFGDIQRGFVSVTVCRPGQSQPSWYTSWTRI